MSGDETPELGVRVQYPGRRRFGLTFQWLAPEQTTRRSKFIVVTGVHNRRATATLASKHPSKLRKALVQPSHFPMAAKTNPPTIIDLRTFKKGGLVLTSAFCEAMAEAAAVTLHQLGHVSGVAMKLDGVCTGTTPVHWDLVTNAQVLTWAEHTEATNLGACACAIIIAEHVTGHSVVSKARIRTGFDYWLGDASNAGLFQNKARLEVSGIRSGNESQIRARVVSKQKQTTVSDATQLPAFVVVLEFSRPAAAVTER